MSERKPAVRNGNLELMRLVSMLLIVSYHYCIWGFFDEEIIFSSNKIAVDLLCAYSCSGMLLFVLLSGYCTVEGRFTLKKLLTMMGMIWFYSLGALLFFLIFDRGRVGRADVLDAIFPLLRQHYWYMTYYTALMLCSPFLNRLVHALDRRQHALLCLLSIVILTGIPLILDSLDGTTLVAFFVLYLCAAYVRLHMPKEKRVGDRCLLLAVLLMLVVAAVVIRRDIAWQRSGDAEALLNSIGFICRHDKLPAVALALLLLCAFACRPASDGGPLAKLGALCVGVYLFQSNGLISLRLWQDILHTRDFTYSPLMPLHAVGSLLAVFAVSMTIEALRRRFVAPLWAKLVDRIAPPLESALNRFFDLLLALGRKILREE